MVEVEGQLSVIEEGILLDPLVIAEFGSLPEGIHRRNLVLGLDIGITHLVGSDLPDRIAALAHLAEVVDRSLEVAQAVLQRAGVESVGRIQHRFLGDGHVIVFLGLAGIALHQIRLGQDAGQAGLALVRDLPIHFVTVTGHIFIVLLHELALQHVVGGLLGEAGVLRGSLEEREGILETVLGIVHIAAGILGRSRKLGGRALDYRIEAHARLVIFADGVIAIGAFEKQLRKVLAGQALGIDHSKLGGGFRISAVIEEAGCVKVMDGGRQGCLAIPAVIVVDGLLITGGFLLDSTQQRIPGAHRILRVTGGKILEQHPRPVEHSVFIQTDRFPVSFGERTGQCPGRPGGDNRSQYGRRQAFEFHILTFMLLTFKFTIYNLQIYSFFRYLCQ